MSLEVSREIHRDITMSDGKRYDVCLKKNWHGKTFDREYCVSKISVSLNGHKIQSIYFNKNGAEEFVVINRTVLALIDTLPSLDASTDEEALREALDARKALGNPCLYGNHSAPPRLIL